MVKKSIPAPAVDRRVLRTREALRVAMMQLMVEVGWDAIDVHTLCVRANVGRSTFYQHFVNKEELLVGSLDDMKNVLLQHAANASTAQTGLKFVPGLLAHVYESQEVFRAVLGRRSGHFVQDRFRELLVQMVLKEKLPNNTQAWHNKAKAHFIGGALMEMMVWWLSVKRLQKPQEIADLFAQWSAPLLEE